MIFCILKLLSSYLVEKTPTKPTIPNILCHESLFEGKIIAIKMIAFLGIMYLFSSQFYLLSVLYTQKSLCNKREAVDKSVVASRQGET